MAKNEIGMFVSNIHCGVVHSVREDKFLGQSLTFFCFQCHPQHSLLAFEY